MNPSESIGVHQWFYSPELCQVIGTQTLWGETTCHIWLSGSDSVVRVSASSLRPFENAVETYTLG